MRDVPLAARIAILAFVGVALVQLVGAAGYLWDRFSDDNLGRGLARQIVATVDLFEAADAPPNVLLEAVSNPLIRVSLTPSATPSALQGWRSVSNGRAARLRAHLGRLGERDVLIRKRAWGWREAWQDDDPEAERRRHHGPLPLRERFVVSVPLSDGDWLHFRVAAGGLAVSQAIRTGLFTGITVLVVGALLVWGSRRLAAPVSRFADAADRLGVDLQAPPLPEEGGRELRRAASAFNRMQRRLQRLVDDRTMMLAAISHDLRTALTRLRLRTGLIDDEVQQAKAERDLEEMQAILEAALALAKSDIDGEPTRPLDLPSLLRSLLDERLELTDDLAYRGPDRLTVQGRPTALRRLFANLIDNAMRYAKDIDVSVKGDTGAGSIRIDIADRGPGVPPGDLDRLFEPFFRVEASRSRETGGAGLGLAIARSIARSHGGDIEAHNRDGGGLCVSVTLGA